MSETELKPCPWCGGEACIRRTTFLGLMPHWEAFCWLCGISLVSEFDTEAQAIKAWNTRKQV